MTVFNIRSRTLRRAAVAALTGLATLAGTLPIHAAPWANRTQFAAPAFQRVWSSTDQAVIDGRVARSYTWGPGPWFDYKEFYVQSPNGLRQVQYFDKARMEINDPNNTSGPLGGVTNGLLTVELVSGRLKVGDNIGDDQNFQRQPAQVPVAGDPGNVNANAPTYASFKGVATFDNGYRDPNRNGQRVGATLDKAGNLTNNVELAKDPATTIVTYNTVTGHNIPRVFRDFINNGPINGLFAFGLPISDPYWVRAKVGGVEKDILVQLYERRVVTYTPSNADGFKVEMGNVGQHYFQWRYPHLGQPWLPNADYWNLPIAYASKEQTPDHWETYLVGPPNGPGTRITAGDAETVPYSWRRSYVTGATPRLMTDSKRINNARKLFSIDIINYSDVKQHSPGFESTTSFFNGAVSPDGTQIAMALQTPDGSYLALQAYGADQLYPTLITPYGNGCVYQSPTWLPDGSGLVYAATCGGKLAIYRADIKYNFFASDSYTAAELVNVRPLTNVPTADNYFPRVSPDGTQVVFSSNRDGNGEIYLMNSDGSNVRRLTNNPADDGAATWSPDSKELVFDSNRDGDYELYKLTLSQPDNLVQLTSNTVDDRWAVWGQ